MGCTLDIAAKLGDAVGGWSTAAAVVLAVWEVTRRRREALRAKRSDVAGRALIALTKACDAVDAWIGVTADQLDVKDPEIDFGDLHDKVEQEAGKGWAPVEPLLRELHVAVAESTVLLDVTEGSSLAAVHSISAEIREHLEDHLSELNCVPPGEELGVVYRARRDLLKGRSFIRDQFQKGAEELRRIAHMKK